MTANRKVLNKKRSPKTKEVDTYKICDCAPAIEAGLSKWFTRLSQPWNDWADTQSRGSWFRVGVLSRLGVRPIEIDTPLLPYTYTPLPDGAYIRVLRLHPGKSHEPLVCSAHLHLLEDVKYRYDALSYVWGTDEPSHTVLLDGREFKIRRNLWHFLHHLRSPRKHAFDLWADAICIDQSSNDEKNHQVQQMKTVYQYSCQTRIWLGPCNDNMAAFLLGSRSYRHARPNEIIGFEDVLEHVYWSRLWIIQEIVVSQDKLVQFGNYCLEWQSFINRCNEFAIENGKDATGKLGDSSLMKLHNHWGWRKRSHSHERRHYHDLLKLYGNSQCMDVRDRVFGLLGVAGGLTVTVDYNLKALQLFKNVVQNYSPTTVDELALPLWEALELQSSDIFFGMPLHSTFLIPLELWPFRSKWALPEIEVIHGTAIAKTPCDDSYLLYQPHGDEAVQNGDCLYKLQAAGANAYPGSPRLLIVLRYIHITQSLRRWQIGYRTGFRVIGTAVLLHPRDKNTVHATFPAVLEGLHAVSVDGGSPIMNMPLRDFDLIRRAYDFRYLSPSELQRSWQNY